MEKSSSQTARQTPRQVFKKEKPRMAARCRSLLCTTKTRAPKTTVPRRLTSQQWAWKLALRISTPLLRDAARKIVRGKNMILSGLLKAASSEALAACSLFLGSELCRYSIISPQRDRKLDNISINTLFFSLSTATPASSTSPHLRLVAYDLYIREVIGTTLYEASSWASGHF